MKSINSKLFKITVNNIEDFRGDLIFKRGDIKFNTWDIFDINKFNNINNTTVIDLNKLISNKNELMDENYLNNVKKDPREKAFNLMIKASLGEIDKREPIKITKDFYIVDGNATVQTLMLLSWTNKIPVEIVS